MTKKKPERIVNNLSTLTETLHQVIHDVREGAIETKIAEQVFNGAGKYINALRLKVDYRQLKGIIGSLDELEG